MSDSTHLRARARHDLRAARRSSNVKIQRYLVERAFAFAQSAEAISRGASGGSCEPVTLEAPMDDLLMMMAAHLRERAAHCRAMARAASSVGIAEELRTLAEEYDEDATNVETRVPVAGHGHRFGTG